MNKSDRLYPSIWHIAFVCLIYMAFVFNILKDPTLIPGHDNVIYHIPYFKYFTYSFFNGYGLPSWDPSFGGSPIGLTSVSFFPYVPHRLIGYLLYGASGMDIVTAYKITLVVGMLWAATGWWMFLHKLTSSRPAATVATILFLLGGSGITVFHQEQMLATLAWMPWAMLALLKIKDDYRYILVFSILLGMAFTVHYPHIQLLAVISVFLAILASGTLKPSEFLVYAKKWKLIAVSMVCLIAAASVDIYIRQEMNAFSSPIREISETGASAYEEYMMINKLQISSATFQYMLNYLSPVVETVDDQYLFFMGRIWLGLAIPAVLFRFRQSLPALIVAMLMIWASLGINGYMPQILFALKVPLLGQFRQWYHFGPLINLCISVLAAFGFLSVLELLENKARLKLSPVLIVAVSVLIIVGAAYLEGKRYLAAYQERWLLHSERRIGEPTNEEIEGYIKSGYYSASVTQLKFGVNVFRMPHVMFKELTALLDVCEQAALSQPYVAGAVYDTSRLAPEDVSSSIKEFCVKGYFKSAVMADVGGESPLKSVISLMPGKKEGIPPVSTGAANKLAATGYYKVTPRGGELKGRASGPALIVLPFAHKLNLKFKLEDKPTIKYPVYGGAFTGVVVPREGDYHILFDMPYSWYEASLALQFVLLAAVIVMIIYFKKSR